MPTPASPVLGPVAAAGAPQPDAHALVGLSDNELTRRFSVGVENFDRRVLDLSDTQLDTAFLPEVGVGRWPSRVLLGHLADAELVYIHRIRRILGEDNPVFALWDENAFVDAGIYGIPGTGARHPIGAFIAVVHTLRKWTAGWLDTLSPQQWGRPGLHPERGPKTVRTLVEGTTHHLEHHAWFLNRKVERFLRADR